MKLLALFYALLLSILCFGQKINGVNFVSIKKKALTNYTQPLQRISANYIALTPFMLMDKDKPNIDYEVKENYFGDWRENMIPVINEAHFSGVKVLLKPHIWVRNVGWAGNLNFNDKKWGKWENNYRKRMLDFAKFAEENKVEMLCIGVELKNAVQHNPTFFTSLIDSLKAVFSGELIYASNWDNYFNIPFWDKLDYIGLDCYFPISLKQNPSKKEIVKGWQKRIEKMRKFTTKTNKKIIFTEYGYRSTDFSVGKQWEIEYSKDVPVNLELQKLAYSVFFEQVYYNKFVAGGFLWKWYAEDHLYKNTKNSDYTPQHKPAEKVILKWYSKH